MSDLAPTGHLTVSPDQLQKILTLHDAGQYVQAYHATREIGPLQAWSGTEARILAGRLAANLGATRLGNWHFLHAWRKDRRHPEALWFYAHTLLAMRGAAPAWRFVQSQSLPQDASTKAQSYWLSQKGAIVGLLRDFDAAETWLKKADEFGPQPWTCLEWAALFALEDRHDEAEAAARRALELHPWYRPAVQWVAHFLVQKERDEEAVALLTQASERLESGAVHAQLAALQIERKDFAEADRHLDAFERLSPLLELGPRLWLDARRCDLACHRGDYDQALEYARNATGAGDQNPSASLQEKRRRVLAQKMAGPFYAGLIGRLDRRTDAGKRVELPVGYVRQLHKTCGPATLTLIARFWSMPVDQVEVAEEISYAGTTSYSERRWAETHDWYVKAFTVTWESAVALLERGIPFTLTTLEVSSAHLQAVIGYDSTRGTLILRDPGDRHRVEMPVDAMKERYRATGPRGMALVPMAHKEKLVTLPLPDEALHDQLQRFDLALEGHRRAEAGETVQALITQAPEHFLTLHARRTLARYDADPAAELIFTERLLKVFPNDLALELARIQTLRQFGRHEQCLEILKRLATKKETDPTCWLLYAEELGADARKHRESLYWLRKAMRATPPQVPLYARLLDALARMRMIERRYDEAMDLHRFAVCLEDKEEFFAQNYFLDARPRGEAEHVVELLRRRFERFGAKSSQPARTLYSALVQMERFAEAFAVLETAMRLRPRDGDLLTYAADAHTYRGEFDEAERILATAEGVSKPATRLRSLAFLALNREDRPRARDLYQEVLKIEPLAMDAHRAFALLLAQTDDRSATLRHLAAMCQRFPHHFVLAQMHYDWLANDGPAAREPILKKIVDAHPHNPWPRVEYASILAEQDRFEEAQHHLDLAEPLDPEGPFVWHARASLYKKMQRREDCQFALRETIRKNVDFVPPIRELLLQCENLQERRDAVAFVVTELLRQPTNGDGIAGLLVVDEGLEYFPAEELLACKRRILDARSELWQAWWAVEIDLGNLHGRDAEWLAFAQQAVQRFPQRAEIWLGLAEAQRYTGNLVAELQSLERAGDLAPTHFEAARMLSAAHERAGTLDLAKKVLEQAIRRVPMVPTLDLPPTEFPLQSSLYMELAELCWRHGDRESALSHAQKSLRIEPWFQRAWASYSTWCVALDRVDEMIALAFEFTRQRPGDHGVWYRLAIAVQAQQPAPGSAAEQERIKQYVAAYDDASRRFPWAWEYYDAKAEMLAIDGLYDDARKACTPPVFKGKPPPHLRARAAWIKATEGDYDAAKQQIAALIHEDGGFKGAWDFLVDWSMATHEFRELNEAAGELCRRRPQSASALTSRGFARIHADDREAGIEDLRSAVRKDPCYWPAGNQLFEELLNDDDLAGAEATLQTLIEGGLTRNACYLKTNQVQLHARRDNPAIALDVFKDLCEMPVGFVPAHLLERAMRALDLAGWKTQGEQILRDAMKKPNWNTDLAVLFAIQWNPTLANDLPDRIAALDWALAKQPETFRFLDLKAELLANGNQFELAWQVCHERTLPQDQFALDGRAAWVMSRSGRLDDAVLAMKDLVARHPKYYWGWSQLGDWYGRSQQWVDALTVAEQLVVLAPRDPAAYCCRGQAKQFLGDAQAARADFLHALDLQPTHLFASWSLFDLFVRDSEWQRAEKILDKVKKHADKGEWALRKVELTVYQNRKANFAAELENLCRNAETNPVLIHHALMLSEQAGWLLDAEEVLHRCLDLGAHICDPWVRLRVGLGDHRVAGDIHNMVASRPERANCLAAYAMGLAHAKDPRGLRSWIDEHEDDLRGDTPCWAKVGQALAIIDDHGGLADWMSDWAHHAKTTPGMLLPLVKALRSLGEIDEARKVSLFALTRLNPDFASSYHKVWMMFDQALEGDVMPVQRYLETADLGGLDGYHQMIAAMVRAIFFTTTDQATGFARARQLLVDTAQFAAPTNHDPALAGSYQLCVARLAQLHGSLWAKLWRAWRWFVPKLPAEEKKG